MKITDVWQKTKEFIVNHKQRVLFGVSLFLVVFFAGIASGYYVFSRFYNDSSSQIIDPHIAFIGEIYDTIKTNYWEKITDEDLSNIFKLGAEKISANPQVVSPKNKLGVEKMVNEVIKEMADDKKKEFVASLGNIVLVNLQPFGRSQLYSVKDEKGLENNLKNIDPDTDLYSVLGISKNATIENITRAYQEKFAGLNKKKDQPDYRDQLSKIERAKDALTNENAKRAYDATKAEPVVVGELISPSILHLKIKRISPTTFNELKQVAEDFNKGEVLDSLIIDLRGNIGGSMDTIPYLLGPFIGPNQYAIELLHQGEYTPFKTAGGWMPALVRYKKVVILIDSEDQSSAEVLIAALKRYNVGIVVGTKTKGWGTVERVFDLETQIDKNQKYSVYLVHSITIGEDGLPIEGNGVSPTIDISNPKWQKELLQYFDNPLIVSKTAELLVK